MMKGRMGVVRIPLVMKRITLAVVLGLSLGVGVAASGENDPAIELFNGKDFSGWVVPEDNIWWKVEDGAIVVRSGPKKKGSTLWTERSFADFEVELEFMFDGKGDSGVFLRNGKEQIQIGISGSLKRDMTGSPYIPGKGYPVEAEEKKGVKGVKELLKINAWNAMRIRATGPKYEVWLNGTHIMTYTSESAPKEGPVGLQLHGNKVMEISFRNLKARVL